MPENTEANETIHVFELHFPLESLSLRKLHGASIAAAQLFNSSPLVPLNASVRNHNYTNNASLISHGRTVDV